MAELNLPAIDQATIVRPGDTLILRVGADISMQQFQQFRDEVLSKVKESLPGVEVLVVGGVEQIADYRPTESYPT